MRTLAIDSSSWTKTADIWFRNFSLTENALADPVAFVLGAEAVDRDVEEEDP